MTPYDLSDIMALNRKGHQTTRSERSDRAPRRVCRDHGPISESEAIPAGRWKFRCPKCKRFLGLADASDPTEIGKTESASTDITVESVRSVGTRHNIGPTKRAGNLRAGHPEVTAVLPALSMSAPVQMDATMNPMREEVINVTMFTKPERFRVLRLTEEEDFVVDELAKRVLKLVKEDPEFRVVFEVARRTKEENQDTWDFEDELNSE